MSQITHALPRPRAANAEPPWVQWSLIGIALAFLSCFLFIPLAVVFVEAMKKGWAVYLAAVIEPDAVAAIQLTLIAAAITVPMNLVFGIAAAWSIATFEFRGKRVLLTLIDLPFSVRPVIAGLIFVLVFGLQGWLGEWLRDHDLKVVFAVPGIVLATVFVTFPFVARELISLMQAQGTEPEEAARVLGTAGWQIFRRITRPNVKWALLYGVILCNARAMGEFGAVSVVSGHIRGQTNTMPLHIEILYNEYQFAAAFAVALLLALLALVTLVTLALKYAVEQRVKAQQRASSDRAERSSTRGGPSTGPPHAGPPSPRGPGWCRQRPRGILSIEIRNLHKRFGATVVCDQLNLDIPNGELVALLGPSGSGKTSLLRIIAGLEVPDSGRVRFHGADATHTDVRERQVGFVFQHYALFPQMTIFENVAFGLRVRPTRAKPGSGVATRPSDREIKTKVTDLLKLVQLDWIADRYPHQLSGGQRQRIALARALAVEPKVLLLDEPFGALDAKVRKELRRWLRRLHDEMHDEMHVTSVFVTHDQDEAMEVADRIVVMNQGRIEQVGTPDAVYDHPATPFVLQFLGDVNLFRGRTGHTAQLPGGSVGTATADDAHYVRPHELDVVAEGGDGVWDAELSQALTLGPVTRLEFKRDDGSHVDVEMSRARWQQLRETLQLQTGSRAFLKPRRVTRFVAGNETHVLDDPAAVI